MKKFYSCESLEADIAQPRHRQLLIVVYEIIIIYNNE
jgi:hypothetical protein